MEQPSHDASDSRFRLKMPQKILSCNPGPERKNKAETKSGDARSDLESNRPIAMIQNRIARFDIAQKIGKRDVISLRGRAR